MASFLCIPTVLLDGSERVARPLGYFPCNGLAVPSDFAGLIDTAEIHTLTYTIKSSIVVNPIGLALFEWGMKQVGIPADSLTLGSAILEALIQNNVTPLPSEVSDKKVDIVSLYQGRTIHIRGYVPSTVNAGAVSVILETLTMLGCSVSYVTLQDYKDHNSAPISEDWKSSIVSYWSDTDKGFFQFWHEPSADVSAFMTSFLSKIRTPLGTTPTAFQMV